MPQQSFPWDDIERATRARSNDDFQWWLWAFIAFVSVVLVLFGLSALGVTGDGYDDWTGQSEECVDAWLDADPRGRAPLGDCGRPASQPANAARMGHRGTLGPCRPCRVDGWGDGQLAGRPVDVWWSPGRVAAGVVPVAAGGRLWHRRNPGPPGSNERVILGAVPRGRWRRPRVGRAGTPSAGRVAPLAGARP